MKAALEGLRILEPHHRRRARRPGVPRRRPDAPAQDGIHGVAGLRSQQELGRGRRRHLRDHRLLRVLRARSAALRQSRRRPSNCPASATRCIYIPLGVGAVIPPWNFPCAIMAGMTLASIVSGNTVILKPSSDSPDHRREVRGTARRSRHARGRGELLPRRRRQFRRRRRRASQDALHRLHRLARSRPAHQQGRRARKRPARSGSSARSSKWAAKTRSSSTPTPTSTPPSKAWRKPHSASRARSARPARAPSSTSASTTSSSSN